MRAIVALATAVVAPAASASEETFLFRMSPPVVTPAEPEAVITVWAAFDRADFAFYRAIFDIEASEGDFHGGGCILNCGISGPVADGRFVRGFGPSQSHSSADPSNPIAVVRAAWFTDSFEPRDITLISHTASFSVYPDAVSRTPASRMATFTEGSAIIRVRRCYADCDGTDGLDFFDFLCFQDAFATGDFYADCDGSGELDFFDFLCFQNEFALGCE